MLLHLDGVHGSSRPVGPVPPALPRAAIEGRRELMPDVGERKVATADDVTHGARSWG
jgi:hypothetical protein